jgi:hypothetical protein
MSNHCKPNLFILYIHFEYHLTVIEILTKKLNQYE